MTTAFEGSATTEVPVLPDRSEYWLRTDVVSADVLLLRSRECPASIAEAAVRFACSPPTDLPLLGKGNFSDVYDFEGTAAKVTLVKPIADKPVLRSRIENLDRLKSDFVGNLCAFAVFVGLRNKAGPEGPG